MIIGKRMCFAVAQVSFEDSGNRFSTVVPICDKQGNPPDLQDFPERGLLWWMVRGTREFVEAMPGKLLEAEIEKANRDDRPEKLQILPPKAPSPKDIVEMIDFSGPFTTPHDLIDGRDIELDHEPTKYVVVRVQGRSYGPFIAAVRQCDEFGATIQLEKSAQHPLYVMADLSQDPRCLITRIQVSPVSRPPVPPDPVRTVKYMIVPSELLEDAKEKGKPIEIRSDREVLSEVAKALDTKRERREFLARFEQFAEQAEIDDTARDRVERILSRMTEGSEAADSLMAVLLDSQDIRPRIEKAVAAREESEIERRSAAIAAKANARHIQLQKDVDKLQSEFDVKRERQEQELRARETAHRIELEAKTAMERTRIEAEREALEREQDRVKEVLSDSTERLEGWQSGLLRDYLALKPLIDGGSVRSGEVAGSGNDTSSLSGFELSPVVIANSNPEPLDEEEFFGRFVTHVKASGFRFEPDVLVSFHLSMRNDAPVVLGGVSGTGKSSLTRLYSEAAAGEAEPFLLEIDVNPSWSAPSDLYGYVDPVEHRFIPGQAGFFRALAQAAHEAAELGGGARPHFVCFDEMNLAQPEHYMADLIQAMSRAPERRRLRMYDPGAVRRDDPTLEHHDLPLGDNLRLTGTVNFDETTQRLSLRLLDRINMLEVSASEDLHDLEPSGRTGDRVQGAPVLMRDVRRWNREVAVLPRTIEVLREIAPLLNALGAPLTPRRQRAIGQFVGSAPEAICDPDRALDLQILQRILPQIGSLFRPNALSHLEALGDALHGFDTLPRSTRKIRAIRDRERRYSDDVADF